MDTNNLGNYLKINSTARVLCESDWSWDTAGSMRDLDVWVILGGRGKLHTNGTTYHLSRGDCFILRYNERYIGEHDPENPLEVIYVHFDYTDAEGLVIQPSEGSIPRLHRKIINFRFFEELLLKTVAYFNNKSAPEWTAAGWFKAALMEIGSNDMKEEASGLKAEYVAMVEQICESILKSLGNHFKIGEIAHQYNYSQDHFCRIFKSVKGVTPVEFIINAKLEAAKTLLTASSHSITRISEILGYKDICHFSKQFTDKTGISPTAYRKA